MPIAFRRSWTDPDLDQYRDTVVRFLEEEMQPEDEAARKCRLVCLLPETEQDHVKQQDPESQEIGRAHV